MSDLFRKDVLERQGQRILGDIVLASPISHASLVSLLAVIIAGLITFSIFGEYSRKERVIGYLTPDRGLIRLLPSHAGVIEQINIEIGRVVDKGDSLFSIKTDTLSVGHYLNKIHACLLVYHTKCNRICVAHLFVKNSFTIL